MMCKEFEHWLLTRDVLVDKENPAAMAHMAGCQTCKNLYRIDQGLEKSIESAFLQKDLPRGLVDQIELTLDHAQHETWTTPLRTAGLVAGVALVLVMAFMTFFNKPFRYQNLQQLSETAIDRHLKGNKTLSFKAENIETAVIKLSKELQFNVILPDLKTQGYALLGGRLCVLDKCKIAYLLYEKEKKTCSLFIMDYDHLAFEMADGSRFSNDIKGCHTDIWKEKGQVYAMVY